MTLGRWPIVDYDNTIMFKIPDSVEGIRQIRLPVNPQRFPISGRGNWSDRDVVGLGEISLPLFRKQDSITLESFFPRDYDRELCVIDEVELLTPMDYVRIFKDAETTHKVVQLIMTNSNINSFYTIRSFSYSFEGGEPGDIYYSIELKAYQTGKVRKFSGTIVPTNPGVPSELPEGFPVNKTPPTNTDPEEYGDRPPDPMQTVDDFINSTGESMYMLAKRTWNRPELWFAIYAANCDSKGVFKLNFMSERDSRRVKSEKRMDFADDISTAHRLLEPHQRYKLPTEQELATFDNILKR